jgi:hypothetical protein
MRTVFVLLLAFLVLGLVVRKFNIWTRLLLIAVIAGMLLFLYLT